MINKYQTKINALSLCETDRQQVIALINDVVLDCYKLCEQHSNMMIAYDFNDKADTALACGKIIKEYFTNE